MKQESVREMRGQHLGKSLQVSNLCYSTILHNSTFTWKQGERIALMGANGSGKSTLAKILSGRLQCSSGKLTVINGNSKPLWQEVGLIGQHPRSQVIGATVGEELAFSLVNRGDRPETVQDRITETLISLGLEGKEHKSPSNLSGGERQRLVAAAVILAYYPFLILDESLSMLDLNAQRKTYEYISRHAEESGQLWITHDPELAMMQDRLILIKDGRIFEEGSPGEVLSDEALCSSYGILSLKSNYKANKKTGKQTYGQLIQNSSGKSNDSYSNQSKDKPIIIWKDVTIDPGIHLNAMVNNHDFIAVVGSSGSGKSTLLESVIGWRKPTHGKIEISKGMTVSLLLQEAGEYLIGSTVYNEVFYLELLKHGRLNSEEDSQQISYLKNENYLKDFKLENLAKTSPEYLSGGQRQNIALASALRNQPAILLLDEPLLGLDRLKQEETLARIKQVRGNYPITILYVTHNLGEILELANRIWLMKDGEIILDCQADMWENYSNLWDKAGVRVPSKSVFTEVDSYQAIETVNETFKKTNTANEKHIEHEQVLATIDPRLKLLTLLTVSLMLGFSGLDGLLLSSIVVLGLIIMTPRMIISWRSMGYVLAGLAILYAILLGWEGYSGLRIWEGHLNSHGLQEAGYITWKISLIFSLSLLLISTTNYVEQGLAINWFLAPILKRTKSGDFALLLMLTLRFISFFKEEAIQLWKARVVKGPLSPSLRGRIKEISCLALPLFKLTLKRAEDVSENLLGRGYNPINYRVHSHWRWQQRDNYSLLIIMGWILFLGLFLLSGLIIRI